MIAAAPLHLDAGVLVDPPSTPPANQWPERIALTVGIVLFVCVAVWTMWRAWRGHDRSQADIGPLPLPPADLGNALAGPFDGRYLATLTNDGRDRVVAQGLGPAGPALLAVTDAGVYVERTGGRGVFVPTQVLRGARLETAEEGSVFGEGRLVVVIWTHAGRTFQTGFRAEAPRRHVEVVDAVGIVVTRTLARPPSRGKPEADS